MKNNGIQFSIVVGGNPITEYPLHKNGITKYYVEGREGSEYEIHVTNNFGGDVEAVISVDGRSIVDGKEAGNLSQGYIIHFGSSVVIPGWLVDGQTAAKFAFSGKHDSYAAKISNGDVTNVGVIGIRVFTRKKPVKAISSQFDVDRVFNSDNILRSATRGIAASGASSQSIGTKFGEATEFKTTKVNFERGAELCTMALYYDNASGLRKRGIDISPEGKKFLESPDPFPADTGCTPPADWKR
jgi:hypothetical protein